MSFESYPGLRQHMRHVHPEAYEASINTTRKRKNWSAEEMRIAAAAESAYTGRFANQHLLSLFPDRTIDAIKGLRKSPAYITIKNELTAALPASLAECVPPVTQLFSGDELPSDQSSLHTVYLSPRLTYVSSITSKLSTPICNLVDLFNNREPKVALADALDSAVLQLVRTAPLRATTRPAPAMTTLATGVASSCNGLRDTSDCGAKISGFYVRP
jgi:hypothetical protein